MTEQTPEPLPLADITVPTAQLMTITAASITRPTITIPGADGPLVTIHPDGRLEYGEGYEPDEAARQFWEAMGSHAQSPEQQFGRPLAARIDAELQRGQAAADLHSSTAPKGDSDVLRKRIMDLHAPVQHMGQVWCGECSVRRSTGPRSEEWVAFVPYPCRTLGVLGVTG
ncbi:hypothetical protein ACIOEZ_34575 [Streptomyces sp. NPDC087866]|uniref:hypothetical protein n=1 Tax=Streptomyces sp. NPDC087866 TaxID=3365815 RepID=UPI0037FEA64B